MKDKDFILKDVDCGKKTYTVFQCWKRLISYLNVKFRAETFSRMPYSLSTMTLAKRQTYISRKRQLTHRNIVYVHVCVLRFWTQDREKTQVFNLLLVQRRNSHVLVFPRISLDPCYFIV